MKPIILILTILLSVLAADKPAVPLPPVPVSQADQQTLQAANQKVQEAVKELQTQMEIVRLRSTLAAGLSLEEMGPWVQDKQSGAWSITRLAKPEPKPATVKPEPKKESPK